jgi:outer membrane lipoprotein SlyB
MEAVTNHQSGSTRVSPLIVAVAVSVAIAGLIGLSALTGMLPNKRAPMRDEEPVPRGESKPTQPGACAVCGTIESIRTVEVLDEASGTAGPTEPKSGAETGGASANAAPSVHDTLSSVVGGSEGGRYLRKRQVFRVTLRMDDGSFRAISQSGPPTFAVGDKVRVVEGRIVRG